VIEIDIGQLEGAFVMSLGLWMTEEIKYNPDTGRLVTADTWVGKIALLFLMFLAFKVDSFFNKGI